MGCDSANVVKLRILMCQDTSIPFEALLETPRHFVELRTIDNMLGGRAKKVQFPIEYSSIFPSSISIPRPGPLGNSVNPFFIRMGVLRISSFKRSVDIKA